MGDMWILLTVIRRAAVRLLRHLRRGIFLVPVAGMAIALFGLHLWTVAVVLLAVTVAFWRPVVAAALLPLSMVVAGISGLVVAATEPGSGFWRVSVLSVIKRRLIRRLPAVVKRQAILKQVDVKRAVFHGHQVVAARIGGAAQTGGAAGPRPVAQIPAGARLNWAPGPAAQALMAGSTGVKGPVPAPPAGYWPTVRGGIAGGHITPGHGPWLGGLLVPLALLLLTLGLWLLPRSAATLRTHAAGLLTSLRQRMLENRWGILLIPVALLGLTVFGVHPLTVAAVLACVVTAVQWPVIAADLVPLALAAFAARGFMIAAGWPALPAGLGRPVLLYGGILVHSSSRPCWPGLRPVRSS